MSVRSKTILIIFAYLIVLTASAFAISRALLIDQFQDVDSNLIGDKLDQLVKIVDESQDQLASITKDYASQDDTVAYIQSLDPIFFQSNFLPVSLENLRIQLVVLMDRTGKVVNGLTLTGSSETSRLPEALQPFLLAYADPIIHQDIQSIAGFILLGDQLYQVSARPIHNSAGEGPAMGVLLLGRTAGAKEQERWQNWVKANLLILPLAQSSADFQKTAHTIPKNQRWWVETLDEQELAGYLMLYTPQKDISAVVKILTPRTVYQQGIQSLNIFWRVMILVGTVLLLGYLFVFDRLVMRPLQRLAGDLMGLSGEPTVAKRKEIGDILELRQPLETALEKVQKMQHETLAVSNTYRSIIEQAMEGFAIIRWDDLVILDANAAFSLLVDIPREELVGQLIETAIMLHGGIEDAQVFSTAAREQLKQGKPFQ